MVTLSHSAVGTASTVSMPNLQVYPIMGSEGPWCFIRAGERCDHAVLIQGWEGTMPWMSHLLRPMAIQTPSVSLMSLKGGDVGLTKIWIVVTCHCVHAITCAYRSGTYCIYTVPVIVVLCVLIEVPLCIVLDRHMFFNVWLDLWDQITRFGVQFGLDQVCSRSGTKWTLNQTLPENWDSAELDPKPDRTWGLVQSSSGPGPISNRTAASLFESKW